MGGSGGGSGAQGAGGGGGSPISATEMHETTSDVLSEGLLDMLNAGTGLIPDAQDANPYESAVPYDPTVPLKEVFDKFEEFDAMVAQVNEMDLFRQFLDEATNALERVPYEASLYDDIGGSYADRLDTRYAQAKARFAAGAADVNAVQSSTFVIGMALLDLQEQSDADAFDAELGLRTTSLKSQLLTVLIGQMMQLFGVRTEMNLKSAEMLQEVKRQEIVAQNDFFSKDLDIDTKSVMWPLTLYQFAANLMAGPSGGTMSSWSGHDGNTKYSGLVGPSKALSAVSGGLSGAAAGAMAGASLGVAGGGPIGAVVGGVGGALAGGLL